MADPGAAAGPSLGAKDVASVPVCVCQPDQLL